MFFTFLKNLIKTRTSFIEKNFEVKHFTAKYRQQYARLRHNISKHIFEFKQFSIISR